MNCTDHDYRLNSSYDVNNMVYRGVIRVSVCGCELRSLVLA